MALYVFTHEELSDECAGRLHGVLTNWNGQPLVGNTWLIETDKTPQDLKKRALECTGPKGRFVFVQVQKFALWEGNSLSLDARKAMTNIRA